MENEIATAEKVWIIKQALSIFIIKNTALSFDIRPILVNFELEIFFDIGVFEITQIIRKKRLYPFFKPFF